jgi:hypothetical protein
MNYIPVDLSNVQAAGNYQTLPPGVYTLQVKDCRQETARSSGEPKLLVIYEVLDGPDGSKEHLKKTLPRSYSLQPKALMFLKRFLLAAGITDQTIAAGGGYLTEEMIKGTIIRGRVSVRQDNRGRDSNDVEELVGATTTNTNTATVQTQTPYAPPAGFTPPQQVQGWPGNGGGNGQGAFPAPMPPTRR